MASYCERWLTIDADRKTLLLLDRMLRLEWQCIEVADDNTDIVYGDYQLKNDIISPERMIAGLAARFPKASLSLQLLTVDGSCYETLFLNGKSAGSFAYTGLSVTG